MSKLLKHEIYKIVHSPSYWVVLLFLFAFVILAAIDAVVEYNRFLSSFSSYPKDNQGFFIEDINVNGISLYNMWIGGKSGYDFYATVYYFIMPLIVSIPYGLSFAHEKDIGYCRYLYVHRGRLNLYLSKYIACFISGFSIIFFSLLLNVLLVAAFIPARTPDPFEWLFYAIYSDQPFSQLFYCCPLLYVFIYMVMPSIFAGLIVDVTMVLSFYLKNKFAALFGPFLFLLFSRNIMELLLYGRVNIETSPFSMFRGALCGPPTTYTLIIAYLLGLFIATFSITVWKGCHDDVF